MFAKFCICRWLCWETELRIDSFKKNLQDGNTASDYFPEIVVLSKLLQLLLQALQSMPREWGGLPELAAFQHILQQNAVLQHTASGSATASCTTPLKSIEARDNTCNRHLFIAFETVGLEFTCFRSDLNVPWKSCSCRPPETCVTFVDSGDLCINSEKKWHKGPNKLTRNLIAKDLEFRN